MPTLGEKFFIPQGHPNEAGKNPRQLTVMTETAPIKIIVAAHKAYRMPLDSMYFPLHVGAEGKVDADGQPLDLGFAKDNTGDNISALNPSFCELTGLYWAWKNLDAEYLGLVHYRRHFGFAGTKDKARSTSKDPFDNILTYEEIRPYLGTIRIFVPKKRHYYIETLYSHYAHTHYAEQLDETRRILEEKYPDYAESYDRVVRKRQGYMFNMMILVRPLLEEYCSWLFAVLFTLKERIRMPELSAFQERFYGRVSEILFNVWLDRKRTEGTVRAEEVMELPCIFTEKTNWRKKGTAFLRAKLFHRKYEESF